MKIYISGAITGIENAEEIFDKAEIHLRNLGYEKIVNPFKLEHNHDCSWENYMKTDLKALMDCDKIYMLPNYKISKGALIEKNLATDLNITIIYGKIL